MRRTLKINLKLRYFLLYKVLSLKIIFPVVIALGLFSFFILAKIIQAHSRKSPSGKEGLIGEKGIAHTDILRKGKVFVHGEIWNAVSKEEIKKEEKIEIVTVKGLTLTVKKAE